jgi:hypothetical protein
MIEDIIKISNKKKIFYHGIKKGEYVEKIKKEGIKPLTPESGPCSFWSTGSSLFYPRMDSPFFNYSGSYSRPDTCELNLAITSYDLLFERGIHLPKYKEDSQITIEEVVPPEVITILNVKVRHPPSTKPSTLRKYRQVAEEMLLSAIAAQIHTFTPGKVIKYFKEIRKS